MKPGDIVKLDRAEGFKAEIGALAIVEDGQTKFPALYNELYNRFNKKDADEFIWITWIKDDNRWQGQPDGAASSVRFSIVKSGLLA